MISKKENSAMIRREFEEIGKHTVRVNNIDGGEIYKLFEQLISNEKQDNN